MTAPPTSRRLHLVRSALSGLLPPLQPSLLPTPPREGRRLVTNKDASTKQDLRRDAFETDASRRRSMTRCSLLQTPSGLSLDGFTFEALAPLDPPPGIACRLVQHNTTRGRIRSPRSPHPISRTWVTYPRRDPPAEHHRARSTDVLRRHRAPPASYPGIRVTPPNSEGQKNPSFHRQSRDPALQCVPRRPHLGYRPDAFHRRPPGTPIPVSESGARLPRIVRLAAVSSQRDGSAFFASREPPTFDGHHDLDRLDRPSDARGPRYPI
jgi:hypothetical protein